MPRITEKCRFNITLLKNDFDFNNPHDFIRNYQTASLESVPGLRDVLIYKKIGNSASPKWLISIKDKLLPANSIIGFTPASQSSGITIFIKIPDSNMQKSPLGYRIFAINYGILGRFNIEKSAIQKNFGLYTAIKILSDHNAHIKSSQSRITQDPPVNKQIYFGADEIELESLTSFMESNEAISEVSLQDIAIGEFSKMIGKATGLSIQIKFQTSNRPYLSNIAPKLKQILDVYNSVTKDDIRPLFKDLFPLDESDNASLINNLNNELINKLSSLSADDRFYLFEPEIDFDMSDIDTIRIVTSSQTRAYDTLGLQNYLTLQPSPTLDNLQSDTLELLDGEGQTRKEWSIFKALYGELEYNGTNYILSNEIWYEVPRNKFQRVNQKIQERTDTAFSIPPSVKEASQSAITAALASTQAAVATSRKKPKPVPKEHLFNEKYCEYLHGQFFDESRKQIKINGTKFEVCDIFIPARDGRKQEFIHCKHNSGAAVLSHLFNQGLVSAKSYTEFKSDYLAEANKHIAAAANKIIENHHGSIIRYLIIDDKQANALTFFSKMALEEIIRNLESRGLIVKLCWVSGIYPSGSSNNNQTPA